MQEPDPATLITLDQYCSRFGVALGTARRQVRGVPGLAWKVRGKVMIDPAKAAEVNRPRPAWVGAEVGG